MVKDPICGTYVEKDGSIRVREGEKVHVFCSYECRDKYLKQIEAVTVESDADQGQGIRFRTILPNHRKYEKALNRAFFCGRGFALIPAKVHHFAF